jgi:hypothetical protein
VVLSVLDVLVNGNNDVKLNLYEHWRDNLDIVAFPVEQIHHNSWLLLKMMDQEIVDEYKVIVFLSVYFDSMDHVEPIA